MNKYLLAFLTFLSLTFTSTASLAMPLPQSCPNASFIKNVPFSHAIDFMGYFVGNIDFFGTDSVWIFVMGPISAESEADAMTKGGEIVQDLSGKPIPELEDGDLTCTYDLPAPYVAIAQYSGDQMPSSLNDIKTRIINSLISIVGSTG